jgi:hypothetical protein
MILGDEVLKEQTWQGIFCQNLGGDLDYMGFLKSEKILSANVDQKAPLSAVQMHTIQLKNSLLHMTVCHLWINFRFP